MAEETLDVLSERKAFVCEKIWAEEERKEENSHALNVHFEVPPQALDSPKIGNMRR